MDKRTLPDGFIETLIIKGMMTDDQYTASVASTFNKEYFNDDIIGNIFDYIKTHFKKYNQLPPKDIILKTVDNSEGIFKEIESIDYDIASNYDHLLEETNQYLKEQSFKDALMKGVEIVNSGKNPLEYKSIIEDALAKDLKIDLGTDYWGTLTERLNRILTQSTEKIPTGFLELDEFISGGFPPYTLNLFGSKIGGFKTQFLVNLCSRQVLKGYNPIIFSMEISEDALCQRLDAIYSKQEINSIYVKSKEKSSMINALKDVKKNNGLGTLIIKELPPGKTSVQDMDNILRELKYRKIHPGPIYVDYLQLLKGVKGSDKRHEELKYISEELRTLSLNWNTPLNGVFQLNRDGIFSDFDSIDYTYTAGSIDIAATADFMAIFGRSEDDLVYESELHYKIVKNRLGRVGETGKLYIDKHSLKMYDNSELDVWIEDAKISGDKRKLHKR